MNNILLDYIKTCRDSGFSDAEIVEQLIQVGWAKIEIEAAIAGKRVIKKKVSKFTFPKFNFPLFSKKVSAEKQSSTSEKTNEKKIKPFGILKGKFSGVKLSKIKPNFAFILTPRSKKQVLNTKKHESINEVVTTAPENHQVVMGPDGHKYYVYFYPVPAQLEPNMPVTNPMQQVMQQPYYIPMPGNMNSQMPIYPYAPMPYPMYGQAQFMQMGQQQYPQGYPGFAPQQTELKNSKFWHTFDIAKRVTLIVAVLFAVIYVASYFLQLREDAAKVNANEDEKTIENMGILREKFEAYYQKNKKLPGTIKDIDSKAEFSTNSQTNQVYDYKIISSSNFHICTVFNSGGDTYTKGYVCQPYEVNSMGMVAAGLPINPADKAETLPLTGDLKSYPGCSNPKPLLSANPKCDASDHTNCRRPQDKQEFGMSSVGLSNSKDRIAQTFKLPKNAGATMITQFDPYIIDFSSKGTACMAIYETEFDNEPLSGKVLAEYSIDLKTLEKESYNSLFIDPLNLNPEKTYSFVFSLMKDDDSSLTFGRGMELSSYHDGNAYYLKQSLEVCTKNCQPVEWINREDDLRFKIRFY